MHQVFTYKQICRSVLVAFRAHHRKDNNHDDIVNVFEMFSWVVINTSQTGLLDLFVYNPKKAHLWYWIEIKSKKSDKLTSAEVRFISDHMEHSRVVRDAGDVQKLVNGKLGIDTNTVEINRYYEKLK